MATGALDANGIWQYGEDDSETTFSGLLNKLASSTSDTVTRLEGFTGYTGLLPIANGGTNANTVAGAQDNLRVGLVPISPSSVAQAGGSASANTLGFVTFNGCTSVSLNGVFTSSYRRYKIVFAATLGSTTNIHMRMRATTDDSTANYFTGSRRDDSSGVGAAYSLSAQTYWVVGGGALNWAVHGSLDIYDPQILSSTRATIQASGHTGSHTASYAGALALNTNTAYDGFTLYPAAGSSSGAIQVFGYND